MCVIVLETLRQWKHSEKALATRAFKYFALLWESVPDTVKNNNNLLDLANCKEHEIQSNQLDPKFTFLQ